MYLGTILLLPYPSFNLEPYQPIRVISSACYGSLWYGSNLFCPVFMICYHGYISLGYFLDLASRVKSNLIFNFLVSSKLNCYLYSSVVEFCAAVVRQQYTMFLNVCQLPSEHPAHLTRRTLWSTGYHPSQ